MPRTTSYKDRPRYDDELFRAFMGRVKLRLVQLDLNQAELARRLEIDHATISGWMSLKYMPKFTAIPLLGEALECSLDWLYTGKGTPNPKEGLPSAAGQFQGASLALADVQTALNKISREWMERGAERLRR